MRVVTWDLEIAEPINEHKGGWAAAKRGECGIASVVLYDTTTERYHVYDPFTMEACVAHLNAADLLVGFNSVEFDYPCILGYAGIPITTPHYDILQEIWRALADGSRGHGVWGLGKVCERALGLSKSGSGEGAPKLLEEGRYGELIDYNINDVHLTRKLANYIHEHGFVIRPDGKPLHLRGPGAPC